MEDIDVVDELEAGPGLRKAPLLKVLCILTWVYTFFIVLFLSVYFLNATNIQKLIGRPINSTGSVVFIFGIAMPLLCSVGAFLMWFKNRIGFVIYGIGQLSPVIYTFYQFITTMGFEANGVFFVVLRSLIPIGFFVLYATQLKYMKPWRK